MQFVVAAAGRARVVRTAVARDRFGHDVKLLGVEDIGETLVHIGERQHVHGVRLRARRAEIDVASRPRYPKLHFSREVPRLDGFVRNRPIAAHAVHRLELEIGRQQAPRGGSPMPRRPADKPQILRSIRIFTLLDQVVILGRILRMRRVRRGRIRRSKIRLRGRIAKVLDDLPARNARSRFEQDHGCAGARKLVRHETARDAGADHHHIGGIRICHLLLSCEVGSCFVELRACSAVVWDVA